MKKKKKCLLKIKGITGNWIVKYRRNAHHLDIKFKSPDGREGMQMEFVEITYRLNYERFRELVESAIWELEKGLIGDRTFRVEIWARNAGALDLDKESINGCQLVAVPQAKKGQTMFYFETPDGEIIHKRGLLEDFELEE